MKGRILFKLFGAALLIVIAVTAILDLAIRRAWERSLREQVALSLTQKAQMFAQRAVSTHTPQLPAIAAQVGEAANARATIIDQNGTVLADTEANPEEIRDHQGIWDLYRQGFPSQRRAHAEALGRAGIARSHRDRAPGKNEA